MKLVRKYMGHGAGIAILLVAALGLVSNKSEAPKQQGPEVTRPKTGPEYAKTAAMILAPSKQSGGSGVILHSAKTGSLILTNKHVCGVIQKGGFVKTTTKEVQVQQYKMYTKHDLCLVYVKEDLGVATQIAAAPPVLYTESITSGHPNLLPSINSHGSFTEKMEIDIMIGAKACDGTEKDDDAAYCFWTGQKPIIKRYLSQVSSSMIMAGSSGSAVFNADGDISGLVFAGQAGGLSYAFLVPYESVRDFIATADKYKWVKADPNAKVKNVLEGVFKFRNSCAGYRMMQTQCQTVKFPSIWSVE